MPRTLLLSLVALVPLAVPATVQGQSLVVNDPYKIVVAPRHYWNYVVATDPAADLIRAQGQFLMDIEKVKLMQQQVQQEKLITRQKVIEHWAWERRFMTLELEKQRDLARAIEDRRVANDPPPAEIYSGAVLNRLLIRLQQRIVDVSKGESNPVKAAWLPHLNVNRDVGNSGVLRTKEIPWPLMVLGRHDLDPYRKKIEGLRVQARDAALEGQRGADYVTDFRRALTELETLLRDEVRRGAGEGEWGPGDYVAAIRSVHELRDASAILKRPDAAFYLKPLKGDTVAEVVQHMQDEGLTFAPAVYGEERYYDAFYKAMRNELGRVGGVPSLSDLVGDGK
jgi:hypothetical protein